jgi:hypothetical protein
MNWEEAAKICVRMVKSELIEPIGETQAYNDACMELRDKFLTLAGIELETWEWWGHLDD